MSGTDDAARTCPRRPPGRSPRPPPTLRPRPAGRRRARRRPAAAGADAVVDCAVYVDGRAAGAGRPGGRAAGGHRAQGGFVWLGLYEPTEDELSAIAARYGLHPLAVEDAVYAHQRPKLEHYDDALFMVLKTATLRGARAADRDQRGRRHRRGHGLPRRELRDHRAARRARRADRAARAGWRSSATCSAWARPPSSTPSPTYVVDNFVEVAGAVEEDVDELEASVFSPERTDDIGRLYQLKRELMSLRRAVSPLEVPLQKLAERQIDVVPDAMRSYFRDVSDHAIRVRDQVGALDELLSSILQASLARTLAGRQRGHAQDLRLGRHHRRPHGDRRHLRHELPAHAGAELALRLSRWCCWSSCVACVLLYRGFKRNGWL